MRVLVREEVIGPTRPLPRAAHRDSPVMLTSRAAPADRLRGLPAGGGDHLSTLCRVTEPARRPMVAECAP